MAASEQRRERRPNGAIGTGCGRQAPRADEEDELGPDTGFGPGIALDEDEPPAKKRAPERVFKRPAGAAAIGIGA